ncbi:hypothetical protein BJV77DRAFT_614769 [Russula vinacea]|nr:hypothetical protein BJV77DRAFT_614769 [Russula vinacea]
MTGALCHKHRIAREFVILCVIFNSDLASTSLRAFLTSQKIRATQSKVIGQTLANASFMFKSRSSCIHHGLVSRRCCCVRSSFVHVPVCCHILPPFGNSARHFLPGLDRLPFPWGVTITDIYFLAREKLSRRLRALTALLFNRWSDNIEKRFFSELGWPNVNPIMIDLFLFC